MGEITINSEVTKKHKAITRDIGDIAEYIGNFRKYLALVHAFGGWDKTSAVQGGRLMCSFRKTGHQRQFAKMG